MDNILNRWMFFHVAVGAFAALALNANATELARVAALPGAALLIGLSFGWAGRSASLLQDEDFSAFILSYGPPPEGYIYSFQLAILTVIAFVVFAVSVAAGGLPISLGSADLNNAANLFAIFTLASIAVRECWGVIYFVNKLTIQFYHIRAAKLKSQKDGG